MRPTPIVPQAGQESVWDYPRPPRAELVRKPVRIVFNGVEIANTNNAVRVLETSHPPVYYIPRVDIRDDALISVPDASSYCEFKGNAQYYSVKVGDRIAERVGWGYANPTSDFSSIAGHVAFYAGPMDGCFVGDEKVTPQPGSFYGGWITSDVVGPFKGGAGSMWW